MSTAMTILGAGITWLLTAFALALIIGRAFALNEREAEVVYLRPLYAVEDEREDAVVPFDRGGCRMIRPGDDPLHDERQEERAQRREDDTQMLDREHRQEQREEARYDAREDDER